MKKLITLLLLAASCYMMANDVIVKTDAERLEVKITAVTKTEITYKMPDYLDGPDFVLSTEEISQIIFENGQVKTYEHQPKAAAPAPVQQYTPAATQNTPATTKTQEASTKPYGRIYRDGNEYMYNDAYISAKEVERILYKNNTYAYDVWKKGSRMAVGGAIVTGVGTGVALVSLAFLHTKNIGLVGGMIGGGLVGMGVGLGVMLSGVSKYGKAIDIYNSKLDYSCTVEFEAAADGVGLALHF